MISIVGTNICLKHFAKFLTMVSTWPQGKSDFGFEREQRRVSILFQHGAMHFVYVYQPQTLGQ
jgi:hypothetical protein